jgi:hypothetical protein
MPQIIVSDDAFHELEWLAVSWNISLAEALDRAIYNITYPGGYEVPARRESAVEVFATFNGIRIDATVNVTTGAVTLHGSPWDGATYASPDLAEDAVTDRLAPDGEPVLAGWAPWRLTATRTSLHDFLHLERPHHEPA